MAKFEWTSTIPASAEALWLFHARPGAFQRLAPPWQRLRLVSWTGGIRDGGRLDFDLLAGPLSLRWAALHEGYVEGRQFQDRQLRGPFARWLHTHACEPVDDRHARLRDSIDYALPLGPLGALADRLKVQADLRRLFTFRHRRTADDIARHARWSDRPSLRIVVAGASGFIGVPLCAFLANAGHRVDRLVRREPRGVIDGPGVEHRWDPDAGELDPRVLDGADAVINLCGQNLAAQRWTGAVKEQLRTSRLRPTGLLARAIARCDNPPRVFLSSSGTNAAPPGAEAVDESAPFGSGFISRLAHDWEEAARPASGVARVVLMRIGFVLGAQGGALGAMSPFFSLGLGGRQGDGRQAVSWIGLDDLLGAIEHALHDAALSGPVHMVAPSPVSNEQFTQTLARVLRRPRLAPMPRWALRAAFGELGGLLCESSAVAPAKLRAAGFSWRYADLESALRLELGLLAP
jgi:uncharacterized protein (TIGR01777 family)